MCVCVCVCGAVCGVSERAVITTLAGGVNGTVGGFADGYGSNARFFEPRGLAVDVNGSVFVTDSNNRIRKVTAGGTRISPVAFHARVADSHVEALA